MSHSAERELAGRTLRIETGRVAKQAGGAVWVYSGETIVQAAATMTREPRPNMDFFPLTCDYEERKYAVGKIPGGFVKRGGRPSEKAVLTSRLIDRPLRPLFPDGMRNDVQVIAMPLSIDRDDLPDTMAIVAASAALMVSNIPWNGPVGAVRVGMIDNEFIINPTFEQLETSKLDLVVAGTKQAIIMVEAGRDFRFRRADSCRHGRRARSHQRAVRTSGRAANAGGQTERRTRTAVTERRNPQRHSGENGNRDSRRDSEPRQSLP